MIDIIISLIKTINKILERKRYIKMAVYYLLDALEVFYKRKEIIAEFLDEKCINDDFKNIEAEDIYLKSMIDYNEKLSGKYERILQDIDNCLPVPDLTKESLARIKQSNHCRYESELKNVASNSCILVVEIICLLKALNEYFSKRYYGNLLNERDLKNINTKYSELMKYKESSLIYKKTEESFKNINSLTKPSFLHPILWLRWNFGGNHNEK
ncbi:MAG: hypothetical protein LBP41_00040 [Holosporaceae bacterium]|jgi:hypothetical protein|nr:hypothetical protein [Holosporaceae bacterium]